MENRNSAGEVIMSILTSSLLWIGILLLLVFSLLLLPWLRTLEERKLRDNRPPSLTRIQELQRLELDQFQLQWLPSLDDSTPEDQILYEIGLVASGACVVIEPAYRVQGSTEATLTMPTDQESSPFWGFTIRTIDEHGFSYGYGPCRWVRRSPQRLPEALALRPPRLNPRLSQEDPTTCRSDGSGSIWCLGRQELAHWRTTQWHPFSFPPQMGVPDWAPIDSSDAVLRSGQVQLHLNRTTGNHAFVPSPGNEDFDGFAGAIRTGRELAYLVVRGYAGEFSAGRIDMAGPPAALRLPLSCHRILQVGWEGELVFALCRSDEAQQLFLGRANRRILSWRDPIEIEADRVGSVIGDESRGLASLTTPESAFLLSWDRHSDLLIEIPTLTGQGRPVALIGGSLEAPLGLAVRDDDLRLWLGDDWHQPTQNSSHEFLWQGLPIPMDSHFVGTSAGIYAVSPVRTALLTKNTSSLLLEHAGRVRAVVGHENRHYLFRQGILQAVTSSRRGDDWFDHPWSGLPIETTSLAVTTSGQIILAGWLQNTPSPPEESQLNGTEDLPAQNDTDIDSLIEANHEPQTTPSPTQASRTPAVRRLGAEHDELMPEWLLEAPEPPLIAADGQGRLYIFGQGLLSWRWSSGYQWSEPVQLTPNITSMVGLDSDLLLIGEQAGQPAVLRCRESTCYRISLPPESGIPQGAAFAWEDGFCLGLRSFGLLCQNPTPFSIPVRFSPLAESNYRLAPSDPWWIVDALPLERSGWLLAVATPEEGFLALLNQGQPASIVALGLDWGEGAVLVSMENKTVFGVEQDGPFELVLTEQRFAVPGMLY